MIRAARSGRFALTSYRPRHTLAPRRAATAIGVTHTAASVGIGSCQTFSGARFRTRRPSHARLTM